MLAAMSHGG